MEMLQTQQQMMRSLPVALPRKLQHLVHGTVLGELVREVGEESTGPATSGASVGAGRKMSVYHKIDPSHSPVPTAQGVEESLAWIHDPDSLEGLMVDWSMVIRKVLMVMKARWPEYGLVEQQRYNKYNKDKQEIAMVSVTIFSSLILGNTKTENISQTAYQSFRNFVFKK